ncbi:hypothetical protein G6F31_013653 [Rhizopus arrhizus]|nr:hypothetical protein G6F31_013653 [Rhizopus arrhizus]
MYDTETWGVELAGTFVKRKDRLASTTAYRPAGYGVTDLMAHWNFAPGATFNVGVFNLADKRYIDWSNVGSTLLPTSRARPPTPPPAPPSPARVAVAWCPPPPPIVRTQERLHRRTERCGLADPGTAGHARHRVVPVSRRRQRTGRLAPGGAGACLPGRGQRGPARKPVLPRWPRPLRVAVVPAAGQRFPGLGPAGGRAAAGPAARQRWQRRRAPVATPGRPPRWPALAVVRVAPACGRRWPHPGRQPVDPVLAGCRHRAPHRSPGRRRRRAGNRRLLLRRRRTATGTADTRRPAADPSLNLMERLSATDGLSTNLQP